MSFLKHLGQGSYGNVWLVYNYFMKCYEAVKVVDKEKYSMQEITNHIAVNNHPNIIQFKNIIFTEKYVFIYMEYADKGDLFSLLQAQPNSCFPENIARYCFYQVMEAISYCHLKKILHRDIKLENILITSKGLLKLCDFGYSIQLDKHDVNKPAGSLGYFAPEVLLRKTHDGKKADIWSLGVLLYTMVVGKYPFEDIDEPKNTMKQIKNILTVNYTFPRYLSSECMDLISKILIFEPNKRLSFDEIKKHPWISK